MSIVFCIGETLAEREAEKTNEVLAEQLESAREAFGDSWKKVVIAYEPVWAIGTGKIASADQTNEAHSFVREWFKKSVSAEVANGMRIIYGGSVTETNCDNLIKLSEVDGFLVGGASIKPIFRNIFEAVYEEAKK